MERNTAHLFCQWCNDILAELPARRCLVLFMYANGRDGLPADGASNEDIDESAVGEYELQQEQFNGIVIRECCALQHLAFSSTVWPVVPTFWHKDRLLVGLPYGR